MQSSKPKVEGKWDMHSCAYIIFNKEFCHSVSSFAFPSQPTTKWHLCSTTALPWMITTITLRFLFHPPPLSVLSASQNFPLTPSQHRHRHTHTPHPPSQPQRSVPQTQQLCTRSTMAATWTVNWDLNCTICQRTLFSLCSYRTICPRDMCNGVHTRTDYYFYHHLRERTVYFSRIIWPQGTSTILTAPPVRKDCLPLLPSSIHGVRLFSWKYLP